MTTKVVDRIIGTVQTTDAATATTICSFTVPTGMSCKLRGSVAGQQGTNSASSEIAGGCINNSGTVTVVGTPAILLTMAAGSSAALATAVLTLVASSNTVLLKVNGVAATTINWCGFLEIGPGYVP